MKDGEGMQGSEDGEVGGGALEEAEIFKKPIQCREKGRMHR